MRRTNLSPLGQRIVELQGELSHGELAAQAGISRNQLYQIKRGASRTKLETADKLVKALAIEDPEQMEEFFALAGFTVPVHRLQHSSPLANDRRCAKLMRQVTRMVADLPPDAQKALMQIFHAEAALFTSLYQTSTSPTHSLGTEQARCRGKSRKDNVQEDNA